MLGTCMLMPAVGEACRRALVTMAGDEKPGGLRRALRACVRAPVVPPRGAHGVEGEGLLPAGAVAEPVQHARDLLRRGALQLAPPLAAHQVLHQRLPGHKPRAHHASAIPLSTLCCICPPEAAPAPGQATQCGPRHRLQGVLLGNGMQAAQQVAQE